MDLSVLRQGVSLGSEFGWEALAEFTRIGEFLEKSIYREGSLRLDREGKISLVLDNPPLRVGAFLGAYLSLDGVELPPEDSWCVDERFGRLRPLSSLSRADPLILRPGESTTFSAKPPGPCGSGVHTVRLTLHSVAIPPPVWLEVTAPLLRSPDDP